MVIQKDAPAFTARARFEAAFAAMPLVAILRGIKPDEVEDVADALVGAGFTLLEVPLNSPDAFTSIARLRTHCPSHVAVGAGTVLTPEDVGRLATVGGDLVVTPNTDPVVIEATARSGMVPLIGCLTPSEALSALRHGAGVLKIFPAGAVGPAYLKDLRPVLPKGTRLVPVGGVSLETMAAFRAAGADGFGFGSALYSPGRPAPDIAARARALVAEWHRLSAVV